eukprot:189114_1
MESLIKFRMLADQLNEEEITTFLTKLIATSNLYPLIVSSIFDHFAAYILKSKQFDSNQINNITNIISQIIESRIYSNEPSENFIDTDSSDIKIDALAPPLLSIISSFLPQKDYISFQITNRNILIGCNSPCSLRSYLWPSFRKPARININKCAFINHLSIDPSSKTQRDEKNISQSMKNILSNQYHINFPSINRFTCGSFYYHNSAREADFLKLVSKFNNLQYLDMVGVNIPGWVDNWSPPLLPKLRGMSLTAQSMRCNRTYRKFLQMYSSQITSLCCSSYVVQENYQFPKLNELKIEINGCDQLNRIIHFTNSLKILSIVFQKNTSIRPRILGNGLLEQPAYSQIKKCIISAFKTQKKLKYLEIVGYKKWFDEIFNSISLALLELITEEKNMLKLQIILQDNRPKREMKWVPIITAVEKVVCILSNCDNINNWMVSCAVIRNKDNVPFSCQDEQLLVSLDDRYLVNYFQEDKQLKFAISNKENPMNDGYSSSGAYCF